MGVPLPGMTVFILKQGSFLHLRLGNVRDILTRLYLKAVIFTTTRDLYKSTNLSIDFLTLFMFLDITQVLSVIFPRFFFHTLFYIKYMYYHIPQT